MPGPFVADSPFACVRRFSSDAAGEGKPEGRRIANNIHEKNMKYLLWLVILGVLWKLWKKRQTVAARPTKPVPPAAENMVTCAYCGVHLPASDALQEAGRSYCSPEHRQAAGPAGK